MTNAQFDTNFTWQQKYESSIKAIIKRNLHHIVDVQVASFEKDTKQSTDMIVTVSGGDSIAVRIRRYPCRYRDLTIRARAWNGGKTEIHKLREGFARWYVYGWVDSIGMISEWMLLDIDKLRDSSLLGDSNIIMNKDGRTGFINLSLINLYDAQALVAARFVNYPQFWRNIPRMIGGQVWQLTPQAILIP